MKLQLLGLQNTTWLGGLVTSQPRFLDKKWNSCAGLQGLGSGCHCHVTGCSDLFVRQNSTEVGGGMLHNIGWESTGALRSYVASAGKPQT